MNTTNAAALTKPHLDIDKRHDFVLFYDVTGGNPNGDPDNGNAPRTDPETGHAWVTDVALKRKVRNFIADAYPDTKILVSEETSALNKAMRESSEHLKMPTIPKGKKRSALDQKAVAAEMARRYFDVRAFGAVMSTGADPGGQLRGPLQFTALATSVEPIRAADLTITRILPTTEQAVDEGKDREMGSKHTVPYALIRAHGFYSPSLAAKTGFTAQDLERFWDALQRMWSLDRSASRGLTGCRGIHIFTHNDRYGRCHADRLFSRITATRTTDGPARHFSDYTIGANTNTTELAELGITYTFLDDITPTPPHNGPATTESNGHAVLTGQGRTSPTHP
jgi:CRISPR-associated protein Csd2